MAAEDLIHIVIGGGIVLGAYRPGSADSAELHKRCITGASIVSCELRERVPQEILDDLHAEWEGTDDDDTPVTMVSVDDVD